MPRPPLLILLTAPIEVAPVEDAPVGDAPVGDAPPIEAGSLRLLTGHVAIPRAPDMSASSSGLGSAMAPPRWLRPLGYWPAHCPCFLIVNLDQA